MQVNCPNCDYAGLWAEWERGERVFYDERDDLLDRDGVYAGYGTPVSECPECGILLVEVEPIST